MKYNEILLSLIPKGLLWEGENFLKLMNGISCIFDRISNDINAIYDECLPISSKLLIDEWEKLFNIKNKNKSISERQKYAAAIMCASGGNTDEFFISIAKIFDKNVHLVKNSDNIDFIASKSKAGHSLGVEKIPKFTAIFVFNIEENQDCINILEKFKPAHLHFIYRFRKN
ncbi:putative phage tail protein [Silvanigrella aquatica]|uniref:Phage tail protein n=1 Tax=Silvanigrella aquatica TaxID=1915309 RepID=A0A1L4D181_9BACT|nr:putative phage tail protein [Silvanigrella aquatica]APJ03947.1 hypothetical protein AXG55_08525 [Silvanigrella aquatica]